MTGQQVAAPSSLCCGAKSRRSVVAQIGGQHDALPFLPLLSDAEMGEDVAEDFVGGDLVAGDVGQMVEGLSQVLGYEVAGEILPKCCRYTLERLVCSGEGSVVAGIGDDDVAVGGGELFGFAEELVL